MNEPLALRLTGQSPGLRYQSGETVLESLHGELHSALDDVPVEVQVEGQVQVLGDAPGERGEGAVVYHGDWSDDNRATDSAICLTPGQQPENALHTSGTGIFNTKASHHRRSGVQALLC